MDLLQFMIELDIQYYLEVKKNDFIFNRVRYFPGVKSGITNAISQDYANIKVDSYDSLLRKNNDFY